MSNQKQGLFRSANKKEENASAIMRDRQTIRQHNLFIRYCKIISTEETYLQRIGVFGRFYTQKIWYTYYTLDGIRKGVWISKINQERCGQEK